MANFPQELHSIVLNKRQLAGGFAPSPPKGRQVPTKQQRRRMWPLRCARRKGGSPAFRQSSMCHRQLIGEIWTRQQSSSPAHRQSCHEGQKHWLPPFAAHLPSSGVRSGGLGSHNVLLGRRRRASRNSLSAVSNFRLATFSSRWKVTSHFVGEALFRPQFGSISPHCRPPSLSTTATMAPAESKLRVDAPAFCPRSNPIDVPSSSAGDQDTHGLPEDPWALSSEVSGWVRGVASRGGPGASCAHCLACIRVGRVR